MSSISVRKRPFKQNGYPHQDFHFFNEQELENEDDFETPSRTEEFVLVVVLKGTIKAKINLNYLEVNRGNVVLLAPNAVKQMVSKSTGCRFIGISFRPVFLTQVGMSKHKQDLFRIVSEIRAHVLDLSETELNSLLVYMNNIEQNFNRLKVHLFAEELIRTNFSGILYELGNIACRQNKVTRQRSSRKEAIAIQFGSLAIEHFRERKQLQFYANEIFVTAKYLTETVKEVTGKTAGELLDELVIREAKLMLENPNTGISEIAIALNFSDQSFFGKFFKRHAGYSPREFRTTVLGGRCSKFQD